MAAFHKGTAPEQLQNRAVWLHEGDVRHCSTMHTNHKARVSEYGDCFANDAGTGIKTCDIEPTA